MKTLRQLLTEYCEKEGYDTDDEVLEECLRESSKTVWEGEHDERRWRTEYMVVSKWGDRFFKYSAFIAKTQDGDAESCGYYFEGIDDVSEVYPHKVTATVYKSSPA